ncbi:hypothetical protein D3C78_1874800 [compost metagenome]
MVGDHLLGEGLYFGILSFFQSQLAGDHFGNTGLGGRFDEVIGTCRHRVYRCQAQYHGKTDALDEETAHASLLKPWRDLSVAYG